jgi:hypothetical protein
MATVEESKSTSIVFVRRPLRFMSEQETVTAAPSEGPSFAPIQRLTIPFTSRSLHGEIQATLRPNHDPAHAHGLDLIFPSTPSSSFPTQFFGFPVLHGHVTFPIPASPHPTYACLFGWFQFVRSVPLGTPPDADLKYSGWEMDVYPYAKDLQTPVTYWGYNPSIFDAPAILLDESGKVDEKEWRAQSFLTVLEDAGMTKRVKLVPGAAFGWGFDIRAKEDGNGRDIVIKGLEVLDAQKEWNGKLELLRDLYPAWTFLD